MPEILRQYRMKFEFVPEGQRTHPEKNNLGLRSKLGGEPDWCQSPEVPKCKGCKEKMTFVAQLDSIEHHTRHNPIPEEVFADGRGQLYMFGDVGMLYVFVCFNCMETKSVLQCG